MNEINWHAQRFDQLTTKQLYQIMQLRVEVFVVEQTCYYQDLDGNDLLDDTMHVMAYRDGNIIAYARVLAPNVSYPDLASIGRVIIAKEARGIKLGDELIRQSLIQCDKYWPGIGIKISAQQHLQSYYGKHGFETVSSMYLEDDIPHVAMCRTSRD